MCESNLDLLDFAIKHKVFISFGGDITYNKDKQKFLKKVPLKLLVLETDSPFFAPHPPRHSGERSDSRILNTPSNLKKVEEYIAKILNRNIQKITYENSLKLFDL